MLTLLLLPLLYSFTILPGYFDKSELIKKNSLQSKDKPYVAYSLDPKNVNCSGRELIAVYNWGLKLLKEKRFDDAAVCFKQLDNQYPQAWYVLAASLFKEEPEQKKELVFNYLSRAVLSDAWQSSDAARDKALSLYGYMYLVGYGVKKNYKIAKDFLSKAAHNKEIDALLNIGWLNVQRGTKDDIQNAHENFYVAFMQEDTSEYHMRKALSGLHYLAQIKNYFPSQCVLVKEIGDAKIQTGEAAVELFKKISRPLSQDNWKLLCESGALDAWKSLATAQDAQVNFFLGKLLYESRSRGGKKKAKKNINSALNCLTIAAETLQQARLYLFRVYITEGKINEVHQLFEKWMQSYDEKDKEQIKDIQQFAVLIKKHSGKLVQKAEGAYLLAKLYQMDLPEHKRDFAKQMRYLEIAHEKGHLAATFDLGFLYRDCESDIKLPGCEGHKKAAGCFYKVLLNSRDENLKIKALEGLRVLKAAGCLSAIFHITTWLLNKKKFDEAFQQLEKICDLVVESSDKKELVLFSKSDEFALFEKLVSYNGKMSYEKEAASLAKILLLVATIELSQKKSEEAINALTKAAACYEKAQGSGVDYSQTLFTTYLFLGQCLENNNDYKNAGTYYFKACGLIQESQAAETKLAQLVFGRKYEIDTEEEFYIVLNILEHMAQEDATGELAWKSYEALQLLATKIDVDTLNIHLLKFIRQGAEKGWPNSIHDLAMAYALGLYDLEKDDNQAEVLFKQALQKGYSESLAGMGMIRMGQGRFKEMEKYHNQLIEKGDPFLLLGIVNKTIADKAPHEDILNELEMLEKIINRVEIHDIDNLLGKIAESKILTPLNRVAGKKQSKDLVTREVVLTRYILGIYFYKLAQKNLVKNADGFSIAKAYFTSVIKNRRFVCEEQYVRTSLMIAVICFFYGDLEAGSNILTEVMEKYESLAGLQVLLRGLLEELLNMIEQNPTENSQLKEFTNQVRFFIGL